MSRSTALAVALMMMGSVALAQEASFRGLGVIDPNAQPAGSAAGGLSADGSKIVGYSFVYDPNIQLTETIAFIWTESGGFVQLPVPPGLNLDASAATAISDDGFIATGSCGFVNNGFYEIRNGVYWSDAMGGNPTGLLLDSALTTNDITPDGSVMVGATRVPGPWPIIDSAFYFTQGGGVVPLGYLPGGSYSWAEAVSADGSVIVGFGDGPNAVAAFRWTAGTGIEYLAGQEPDVYSSAYGVSPDGSVIVGGYGLPDEEAFRWTEAGEFELLGKLDGARKAYATDLSADGSVIVGYSWFDPGDEAFIWTRSGGMRSLADVLSNDYNLDLTGWTLERATGISDDGSTLCGYGTGPDGNMEAWVAHLPVGGFHLAVDSPCPSGGTATLNWTGATPGGTVGVVFARNEGGFVIPNGNPCAGTRLGLGTRQLQLLRTARSDRDGAGSQAGQMPGAVCGSYLQLLDVAACGTSNVARIE